MNATPKRPRISETSAPESPQRKTPSTFTPHSVSPPLIVAHEAIDIAAVSRHGVLQQRLRTLGEEVLNLLTKLEKQSANLTQRKTRTKGKQLIILTTELWSPFYLYERDRNNMLPLRKTAALRPTLTLQHGHRTSGRCRPRLCPHSGARQRRCIDRLQHASGSETL